MSRRLALAMGSPVSTIPQNDFRTNWKTNRTNSVVAQEKTFSSLLRDSIGDGIRGALGQAILGVLTDQGLFDKASDPKEFQKKLIQAGFEPVTDSGPEQTAAFVQEELKRWTPLLKAAGIKLN